MQFRNCAKFIASFTTRSYFKRTEIRFHVSQNARARILSRCEFVTFISVPRVFVGSFKNARLDGGFKGRREVRDRPRFFATLRCADMFRANQADSGSACR